MTPRVSSGSLAYKVKFVFSFEFRICEFPCAVLLRGAVVQFFELPCEVSVVCISAGVGYLFDVEVRLAEQTPRVSHTEILQILEYARVHFLPENRPQIAGTDVDAFSKALNGERRSKVAVDHLNHLLYDGGGGAVADFLFGAADVVEQ